MSPFSRAAVAIVLTHPNTVAVVVAMRHATHRLQFSGDATDADVERRIGAKMYSDVAMAIHSRPKHTDR